MLQKITNRIFIMPPNPETDRPALGLICGDKFSVIIDSGISAKHAREFLYECSQLNRSPLKYLVLTHHHYDHVLGMREMNLLTIAQEQIKEEINMMKTYKWDDLSLEQYIEEGIFTRFGVDCIKAENEHRDTLRIGEVDLTFSASMHIDMGGVTCEIKTVENPHVDGSVIIYIQEEKVLFMGDCIYGRKVNGIYGYDKVKYEILKTAISEYDAEYYIISHEDVLDKKMLEELWVEIEKEVTFF